MKLGGEDRPAGSLDRRCKAAAIGCARHLRRRLTQPQMVAVHEIEVAGHRNSFKENRARLCGHLIPADMRNPFIGILWNEAYHFAVHKIKTFDRSVRRALRARLRHQLHAQTGTEKRHLTGATALANRIEQAPTLEVAHGGSEVSDARQDDAVGAIDDSRVARALDLLRSAFLKSADHRIDVTQPVIDDDGQSGSHYRPARRHWSSNSAIRLPSRSRIGLPRLSVLNSRLLVKRS